MIMNAYGIRFYFYPPPISWLCTAACWTEAICLRKTLDNSKSSSSSGCESDHLSVHHNFQLAVLSYPENSGFGSGWVQGRSNSGCIREATVSSPARFRRLNWRCKGISPVGRQEGVGADVEPRWEAFSLSRKSFKGR